MIEDEIRQVEYKRVRGGKGKGRRGEQHHTCVHAQEHK